MLDTKKAWFKATSEDNVELYKPDSLRIIPAILSWEFLGVCIDHWKNICKEKESVRINIAYIFFLKMMQCSQKNDCERLCYFYTKAATKNQQDQIIYVAETK